MKRAEQALRASETRMRVLLEAVPDMILELSRDGTTRKQAEVERERLIAELEPQNAELERFTYSVSHDLKGPLITIRGFGFLRKDIAEGHTHQLQNDLARVAVAADKLQCLLDDLLELSRIGRLMNPPQAVPFAEIARDAVEIVRGRLQERGVQISIAEGLPIIYGDRARLVEVI